MQQLYQSHTVEVRPPLEPEIIPNTQFGGGRLDLEPARSAVRQVLEWCDAANNAGAFRRHNGGGADRPADSIDGAGTAGHASAGNSIHKSGQIWRITYKAESGEYAANGNKYLQYLAKVLTQPNRLISIAQLVEDPQGMLAAEGRFRADKETDAEGLAALKRELDDLDSLVEQGATDELAERRVDVVARIERAARGRMAPGSALRKAHHSVCTWIRRFLSARLAGTMPQLATHLTATLKLDFPDIGYFPPKGTPAWKP
jgi:hypothetical protein